MTAQRKHTLYAAIRSSQATDTAAADEHHAPAKPSLAKRLLLRARSGLFRTARSVLVMVGAQLMITLSAMAVLYVLYISGIHHPNDPIDHRLDIALSIAMALAALLAGLCSYNHEKLTGFYRFLLWLGALFCVIMMAALGFFSEELGQAFTQASQGDTP